MGAYIANYVPWPAQNGIIGQCYADTAADLPAASDFPQYGLLVATSTCHVIDEDITYQMDGSGAWHKKHTGVSLDLSGYYTSAEVDNAIASALSGYYTAVQVNSAIGTALSDYYTSAEVDAAIAENDLGTAGTANEDLDNFTWIGHKYWSASNAGTLAHRPLGTQSGSLSAQNFPIGIDPQNPRVAQMVIYNVVSGMAQNRIFIRILSSSGWSGWFELNMNLLV